MLAALTVRSLSLKQCHLACDKALPCRLITATDVAPWGHYAANDVCNQSAAHRAQQLLNDIETPAQPLGAP